MTCTPRPGSAGKCIIPMLLMCSLLLAVPVSAATQYLGDGPSFTATLAGNNEFVPGEDTTISILVKNTGLNWLKQVGVGTIEPEDQQNTAKTATINLGSAGDAVIIRTDPQMVGDIRGGKTVTVPFRVKISANASAGEYQLPLTIRYRYLNVIVQEKADVFEFTYNDAEDTLPITIRIQPRVKAEVLEAVPELLTVGSQGFLNLTIRNAGPENGTLASVKLLRNGQSPIIPVDNTQFIGDFRSGGIVRCRYKISVSQDATNQSYPVDLTVTYTNREGSVVTSTRTTIGVFVNARPAFSILSTVPEVTQGAGSTVEIRYRNDGAVTVYDTQARLALHDPLTPRDNNAYLGDIAPGESVTARYEVQTDEAAEPGVYTFDSRLRYRDALGTSLESDPVPVEIAVVPAPAVPGTFLALAGIIGAVLVAGVAFSVYRQKKEIR